MKPKAFVSSTYYDLKYIRENIKKLLLDLGFDCILFESGDVTFELDKPLDVSCYKEVSNSNMLILIVGGRYGSKASILGMKEYAEKYDKYYTSITKKEYLTAKERGIPIYVFIENSVLTEYETFKKNRDLYYRLESDESNKLNFAHVDSVNVFEFISDLYSTGLPIFKFNRYEDIENQFKSQISGLLYLYLESLVNKKNESKISNTVDIMKNLVERMEKMVQKIGEKVLADDKELLEKIKLEQVKSLVEFCIKKMGEKVNTYDSNNKDDDTVWQRLSEYLLKEYLLKSEFLEYRKYVYRDDAFSKLKLLREQIEKGTRDILFEYGIKLDSIEFDLLEEMSKEIVGYASKSKETYAEVRDKFALALMDNWFPF